MIGALMPRRRRGSLLIDLGASVLLLAIAMTLVVQLIGWVARERREADHRQRALVVAENTLERIEALAYDTLADTASKVALEDGKPDEAIPGARVEVVVADASGDVPAKRVAVIVHAPDRSGAERELARLTTWVHRGEARP